MFDLKELLQLANKDAEFTRLGEALAQKEQQAANVFGLSDSAKALIPLLLREEQELASEQKTPAPLVFLVPDILRARQLLQDLKAFSGEQPSLLTRKASELLAKGTKSRGEEIARLNLLSGLLLASEQMLVVTADALLDSLPPVSYFRDQVFELGLGQDYDFSDLTERLEKLGYVRVGIVDAQGQYSVRGEIIDLGLPGSRFDLATESAGVRLSFFDTQLEAIRLFDLGTQRSLEDMDCLTLAPLQEFVLSREERLQLAAEMERYQHETVVELRRNSVSAKEIKQLEDWLEQDREAFLEGLDFAGIARWNFLLNPNPASILDYAAASGAILIVEEPKLLRERLDAAYAEQIQEARSLLEKHRLLAIQAEYGKAPATLFRDLHRYPGRRLALANLASSGNGLPGGDKFDLRTLEADNYQGRFPQLLQDLKQWQKTGQTVKLVVADEKQKKRLREILLEESISLPINLAELNQGLYWPAAGLHILGTQNLLGRVKRAKRRQRRDGQKIDFFSDLKAGDLVVHDIHGIGRYLGLTKLKTGQAEREYLHIQYAGEDKLYIPVDQLEEVQRYIGGDGASPRLSKLGSNEWERKKARVRESVKKLAVDLVAIYQKRSQSKGFAFSPDTVWQKEFEESFPYVETADQLQAVAEIKADMETDKIMDRLLCGDVGFGKTEVAFRAMFKAVMDSKQVAMLVPTTVLAQQHYESFLQRLGENYALRVRLLSRYVSDKERAETIKGLANGQVDVVIGTHSVLGKQVQFHDLGLLVVDEEQRFGVNHKETIKERYPQVDVLTLSATPIPRTLHMAVSGIRDISLLTEGPEDRRAVQTYVMEYEPEIIDEAILREISRQGQVFYLYNDIRKLPAKQKELEERLPSAEIRIAHGRLSERQMEETIRDFHQGEFDILLCTTIVESGIDMPRVNTLIVERADRMGLSQLYQLRGRVGRSERQAYAYVTYPKDQVLKEDAQKRLAAIRDFTELGSGLNIAMRDLEVRGAGNFLGGEQSGHMGEVGYDLYCRLLAESIQEVQGIAPQAPAPQSMVDLEIDAMIPSSYIDEEGQRMDIYKRILEIHDRESRFDVIDELRDRYGEPPRPVLNLIDISFSKAEAARAGIEKISREGEDLILKIAPESKHSEAVLKLFQNDQLAGQIYFNAGYNPYLKIIDGASRPDHIAGLLASLWL